jgi:DksA/TraR C4-type zinc finger protein
VTSFEHSVRIRLMAMLEGLLRTNPSLGSDGPTPREIEEIEAALLRLGQGTYGMCEECGRALGRQRLLAEPTARRCMPCLHAAGVSA